MKSIKVIAYGTQQSFSLGLDPITMRALVKLQEAPEFTFKDQRVPSRTLVTRQAIRYYQAAVDQARETGRDEWLINQKQQLVQLGQQGKK